MNTKLEIEAHIHENKNQPLLNGLRTLLEKHGLITKRDDRPEDLIHALLLAISDPLEWNVTYEEGSNLLKKAALERLKEKLTAEEQITAGYSMVVSGVLGYVRAKQGRPLTPQQLKDAEIAIRSLSKTSIEYIKNHGLPAH